MQYLLLFIVILGISLVSYKLYRDDEKAMPLCDMNMNCSAHREQFAGDHPDLASDFDVIYEPSDIPYKDPKSSDYLALKMKLVAGHCFNLEEGLVFNQLNEHTSDYPSIAQMAARSNRTPMQYLMELQKMAGSGDRNATEILANYHICPRENSYN